MNSAKTNIVLIGMPGSGKSTVGVVLAKAAALDFVDTDLLIQHEQGRSLQDIVDTEGYRALRRVEERILLALEVRNHVIATGGSAVYSDRAMAHLRAAGVTVFLDVTLETLRARVSDYETRGLAKRPEQTLEDLFAERLAGYRRHADVTIDGNRLTQDQLCRAILAALGTASARDGHD